MTSKVMSLKHYSPNLNLAFMVRHGRVRYVTPFYRYMTDKTIQYQLHLACLSETSIYV